MCCSPCLGYTQSEWKYSPFLIFSHGCDWCPPVSLPRSSLDSHLFTRALGSAMFPWRYKPWDSHKARGTPEAPYSESQPPERSHIGARCSGVFFPRFLKNSVFSTDCLHMKHFRYSYIVYLNLLMTRVTFRHLYLVGFVQERLYFDEFCIGGKQVGLFSMDTANT